MPEVCGAQGWIGGEEVSEQFEIYFEGGDFLLAAWVVEAGDVERYRRWQEVWDL